MAQKITDYTKFITKDERDLYNNLSKTMGNDDMVDYIYDEIIKQKSSGGHRVKSLYGQSQNISGERCNPIDKNIIADLLANNHKRNFDSKLQGTSTNEIIVRDNTVRKVVDFVSGNDVVAYIDNTGAYVGRIGEVSTEDVVNKIKNIVTEQQVTALVNKKVDKVCLFDVDGKVKKELIPDLDIQADVSSHMSNNDIHVTTDDKTRWDGKYNLPEGGIPQENLSQEVIDLIGNSANKLLDESNHIKEEHLNFEVIARKSDLDSRIEELTRTFMEEIEAIKNSIADNNILVIDNVVISGNEITLSHQDIVVTEDFEFTINGIEYFIDTDFELNAQEGTITWTNSLFDLDETMRVVVQYSIDNSK